MTDVLDLYIRHNAYRLLQWDRHFPGQKNPFTVVETPEWRQNAESMLQDLGFTPLQQDTHQVQSMLHALTLWVLIGSMGMYPKKTQVYHFSNAYKSFFTITRTLSKPDPEAFYPVTVAQEICSLTVTLHVQTKPDTWIQKFKDRWYAFLYSPPIQRG